MFYFFERSVPTALKGFIFFFFLIDFLCFEETLAKAEHNKTITPCFYSPPKIYREYSQAQLPTCHLRVHRGESSLVFSLSSSSEPLSAWRAAVALRSNAALNLLGALWH